VGLQNIRVYCILPAVYGGRPGIPHFRNTDIPHFRNRIMQDPSETFSKYDVLVEPPIPGLSSGYSLAKHRDHVGNRRFQVLLAMNQQSYETARMRGNFEECDRVVSALVDVICNQVVPRGRFLESTCAAMSITNREDRWTNMEERTVKSLLHNVLSVSVAPTNQRTDPSEPSFMSTAISSPNAFLDPFDIHIPSATPLSPNGLDSEEGQKRRRRSSLLRRSNSESMLGAFLDNKKKLNLNGFDPRGNTQEEPTSWKSSSSLGELNRMDVVFSPERDALNPSCMSVGNNRLHILLAVRSAQFKNGSMEEQEKILDETIETITTFWKGRFHVEVPGGYDNISNGEAREILWIVLSGRKDSSSARPKRHSDPASAVERSLTKQVAGFEPRTAIMSSTNHHVLSSWPSALMEDALKKQSQACLALKKQMGRNHNANRVKETLGCETRTSTEEQSLFSLGGMLQHSMPGYPANEAQPQPKRFSAYGHGPLSLLPRPMTSMNSFMPRESSVFGAIDAKLMQELAAGLDDSDSNDDLDNPLPPAEVTSFGRHTPNYLGNHPSSQTDRNNVNGNRKSDGGFS
jgi:hypothetical protein